MTVIARRSEAELPRRMGKPPFGKYWLPPFGEILQEYRMATGKDQAALARAVGMNSSYISRLETGARQAPGRSVVQALSNGLGLTPEQEDRLFASAGLLPPSMTLPKEQDPLLAAVSALLYDDAIPYSSREEFRAVLRAFVRRWKLSLAMERLVAQSPAASVSHGSPSTWKS